MIVLNNCTTMGPKYVDRKVMKASRAKPGNRNERRRRKEGGGEGGKRRSSVVGARGWLIGSANKG